MRKKKKVDHVMGEGPWHERWKDYTTAEIVEIKRAKCKQCPYRGVSSSRSGDSTGVYCNYLALTGQARLIRPELCEHHLDSNVDVKESKFGYVPGVPVL